jgi:hypothetical protein
MFKPPEPPSGSFPKQQVTSTFFDAALGMMAHEAAVAAPNSEDDGFTAENAAIDACSHFPTIWDSDREAWQCRWASPSRAD